MTDPVCRCTECGKPLQHADSICVDCDVALKAEIEKVVPDAGRYACPHCHLHFQKAEQALWPLQQKWYKPQSMKGRCPHCKNFIVSKYWTQKMRGLYLLLFTAVVLKSWAGFPNEYFLIAYVVATGGILGILAVVEYRAWNDPHRFISDQSCCPTGNAGES